MIMNISLVIESHTQTPYSFNLQGVTLLFSIRIKSRRTDSNRKQHIEFMGDTKGGGCFSPPLFCNEINFYQKVEMDRRTE